MGKIIILSIVIVGIIVVGFIILGGDASNSVEKSKTKDSEYKSFYKVITEENSYEKVVGFPLPKSSTNITGHTQLYPQREIAIKCSWVMISLPKEDFDKVVSEVGLKQKTDLLELIPDVLECKENEFAKYWDVTNAVNKDTYYQEEPIEKTYRVYKYEQGKLYVKKVTTYVSLTDENGKGFYKKAYRN